MTTIELVVTMHGSIIPHRDTEVRKHRSTGYDSAVASPAAARATRPKRLTLDLSPEIHLALKLRAVELGVPMAELLRGLIERALSEPSTFARMADDLHPK